jgi:hypothetical protein
MMLKDPELIKAARLMAVLQGIVLLAVVLMAVSVAVPFLSSPATDENAPRHLSLISLAGTALSFVIVVPVALLLRTRRRYLPKIDHLLQSGQPRDLEMERKFSFTGLIAFRRSDSQTPPAITPGSRVALAPAWWLQPLVTNDRLPRFGTGATSAHWQPGSADSLLAWRTPKLGWGRVLSAAEIRRQGQQMALMLLGFGLAVPLTIGLMVAVLLSSLPPVDGAMGTAGADLQAQLLVLAIALAVLPLLTLVLAWLTWRETRQIMAAALDPRQL